MPPSLTGQVAVVTGAGQGMGEAFARTLAAAGAHVAVAELNAETGEVVAEDLRRGGGLATAYRVDVRDRSAIQGMVDDLVERHGRVDILVNNAGLAAGGPSEDVTDEQWDLVHGVMLKGVFTCSQIVGRVMLQQRRGVIVNICSIAGVGGWSKRALYTSAKAGAIALTHVLGVEWAPHGVRVVGVNPGQVETALNEAVFKAGLADRETFTNRAPMRRFASPAEIGDAILFLVSDEASGITAETITLDGGWLAWGGIEEPVGV